MKKIIKSVAVILALVCSSFGLSCGEKTAHESTGNIESVESTEIKNMILVIGDGMGMEHIAAGELASGVDFPFTKWDFVSVNTDSVEITGKGPVLTDSAAAGTALATGKLTVNGYVGKDHEGNDLQTILDHAKAKEKATGIITTEPLYGATPSAFSAHAKSRGDTIEIVKGQVKSDIDLLCGHKDDVCALNKSLITANGYTYCDNYAQIQDTLSEPKVYWQFDLATKDAQVKLENVTEHALNFLERDEDGFVLMIEQAYVDKYSHAKDFGGMEASVNSLNRTVEVVRKWIGDRKDTAVLITADHETGGLTVGAENVYNSAYDSATGEKIYYNWKTNDHTNAYVGLFTYGIVLDYSKFNYYGSDHLIKNVDIFYAMYEILNNPTKYSAFTVKKE